MKKKYIFELKLHNGDNYISLGYFNKIEGLTKTKNYKHRRKQIRLYEGIFTEPYLYKYLHKINNGYIWENSNNIEIILYDINSNRIKKFSIGDFSDMEISYNKSFSELTMEGESLFYAFDITPTIMSLWLQQRKSIPTHKDTWVKLSHNQRKEWLGEIASDERLNIRNSNIKIANKILEVNGKIIEDEVSFYFAFGEAVYGAGGYMGTNIHAFEDCLSDKNIKASTLTLIWNNFELSQKYFSKNNEEVFLQNILDVLNEQRVNLVMKNEIKIKISPSLYIKIEEIH